MRYKPEISRLSGMQLLNVASAIGSSFQPGSPCTGRRVMMQKALVRPHLNRNAPSFIAILIPVAFLLIASHVMAATHYIRDGAFGANNGSNWTDAWDELPENLIRGDTYYIADGNYRGYSFDDPESGSTFIYVKKATIPDHGTDVGWVDAYGDGQAEFTRAADSVWIFITGYYDMDGQVGGGPDNWRSAHGFKVRGTVAHTKCIELRGPNWYTTDLPNSCYFRHIEITHRGLNTETRDEGFYNQALGGAAGPSDILIQYCWLHTFGRCCMLTYELNNMVFEYNCIELDSSSGANHGAGWADFGSDNVTIRYNLWADIDGTAFIDIKKNWGQSNENWYVYGNVFMYSEGNPYNLEGVGHGVFAATVETHAPCNNMNFYNNSIINVPGWRSAVFFRDGVGNKVYNNIWYNCYRYTPEQGGNNTPNVIIEGEDIQYDYNIYSGISLRDTLPATHDIIMSEDPFVGWQYGDFSLRSPSESGLPLPSPYGRDLQGIVRGGADGVWDRGAYEYVSGSVDTYTIAATAQAGATVSPSGNIEVQQGSNQTITITAQAGYRITDVIVDGQSMGAIGSYPFTNINQSHTLAANAAAEVQSSQITIDHTAVDMFDEIPSRYIDQVKSMLLNVPGESHSAAYRNGLTLLESIPGYERFDVNVSTNPEAPTDTHLRISPRHRNIDNTAWYYWSGEEDFWTSQAAIDMMKNHLTYLRENGNPVHAFGFGWCWDMSVENNPGGGVDPVYQVRWAGRTYIGPGTSGQVDGGRWGLDDGDTILTDNDINMQDYLDAVVAYNAHMPETVTFFTTGPVDRVIDEAGYQRFLKQKYIRDYVNANGGVLFDYADILTHNDAGVQNTISWTRPSMFTGYEGTTVTYPHIHPDNAEKGDGNDMGHIGAAGATRLGKALWVLMAQIAGWNGTADGSDPTHSVNASALTGGSITPNGILQIADGDNQTFTITPQTGYNIADVLVDGGSVGAVGSYTFANITGNHTIRATFALTQITHTIQASAGTGGSISPNNTTTINQGQSQQFTITPATGYRIADVRADGSSVGAVGSYTFANIASNHTISATFALTTIVTHTIQASADTGGSISPNGTTTINQGQSQQFTIAAATGYRIADVRADGGSIGAVGSYTFANITGNHTISATFAVDTVVSQDSTGPVAWWGHDEGEGDTAQDSSGNGNTGALVGAIWTTEGGLSFDGTDDYVEIPDSDSLDIQNEITLSLWVKLNAYDTDWPKLLIKPYQSTANPWELYTLDLGHYGSTPRLILTDGIPGGDGAVAADSGYNISLNEWHHIAGTYNGSLMSVYVDGNLIATQAANFQIGTNDMPLSIGGRLGVNSFIGSIDEVQIYNRSLTSAEVIELYELNTLKGRWKLDTYSGLNSPDSSGNDNTATLSNGPVWTGAGELKLDGIDDYVDCGSGASSNLTGDLTVSAWIHPESFGAGPLAGGLGRIVDRHGDVSGFAFYVKEEIQGIAYLTYGGDFANSDPGVIDLAQWQHVAVTYSDALDTVTFYVNGQPAGGEDYQTNPNDSANAPLIIGNRAASDRGFDGMLSNIRIYSRTLADDEISAIYRTYEAAENKNLGFEVSTTDSDDYVAQDPLALPTGATFTDNIFTWRPWYNQADSYEITFEVPGQPGLTQSVPMVVENVTLVPWYQSWLSNSQVNKY